MLGKSEAKLVMLRFRNAAKKIIQQNRMQRLLKNPFLAQSQMVSELPKKSQIKRAVAASSSPKARPTELTEF